MEKKNALNKVNKGREKYIFDRKAEDYREEIYSYLYDFVKDNIKSIAKRKKMLEDLNMYFFEIEKEEYDIKKIAKKIGLTKKEISKLDYMCLKLDYINYKLLFVDRYLKREIEVV